LTSVTIPDSVTSIGGGYLYRLLWIDLGVYPQLGRFDWTECLS